MGRGLITAGQFEALIDEGVDYTYTNYRDEVVESTLEGSDFWHEAGDAGDLQLDDKHTAHFVDGETGGEGSAEYIWQVWSVKDAEGNVQYFKKEGYYMSYDGSNWDGTLFEVEPYEKTVTDWRTKK
jgi:pullulanase/glycogen debranching enzyme